METLNLLRIKERYGFTWSAFDDYGLRKDQMSVIARHGRFPIKADVASVKRAIERGLRDLGVTEEEIRTVWGTHPRHPGKLETIEPTLKDQILLGGPAVLEKQILDKIGFERDPFWNEISRPEDVFDSKPHLHILQKMRDAALNAKFIGIHGEVGSGKTVMKNMLFEMLKKEGNFLISEPVISEKSRLRPPTVADSMIQDFLYEFGSIPQTGKLASPRSLEAKNRFLARIMKSNKRQGRRHVVVIDEAHDLPIETIKSMKRFHEIQDGFTKLLGIILVGQPELNDVICKDYRIREVAARIDMIEIRAQTIDAEGYLRWKVQRAGGDFARIFTDSAVSEIKRKLNGAGNPLTLNVLASHAIDKGFRTGTLPVTNEVVELAWKEMGA